MTILIENIKACHKDYFMKMSQAFYKSEAVAHDIAYEYHEKAWAEMMASDTYIEGFIIKHDDENAGYALLNKAYSREVGGVVIWIEELFIEEKFQGNGLATYFFNWLRENYKAARYRLEVEPDNFKAIDLYKRWGFERLGYDQYVLDQS